MRKYTFVARCTDCRKMEMFIAGRYRWAVKGAERVGWGFYYNNADPENSVWRCGACVRAHQAARGTRGDIPANG